MLALPSKAALWVSLVRERLAASGPPEVLATSMDLCRTPALATALGSRPMLATRALPEASATVVGWGRRPSGQRAGRIARRTGARLLLAEDGFLAAAHPDAPRVSCIVDDLGIFYDATTPSRLERLIAEGAETHAQTRAERLASLWVARGLSKFPGLPHHPAPLPEDFVLVIDQTPGDLSIRYGQASAESFGRMLDAARAENPGRTVVVKTHPSGRAHLRPDGAPGTLWIGEPCHPGPLIAAARAVYTVTSQAGFEALLHGRPVRTFGMPFYGGWGLTEDDLPAPDRRGRASLPALVHAALVAYPTYADPATGRVLSPEEAIGLIAPPRPTADPSPPPCLLRPA